MKITGYATVFDSPSVDLGGFVETIRAGAFARSLADGHGVFFIHHHNFADLLGSTRSGSLRLAEDRRGLHFELDLPETSLGRDVHTLVKRGDLASMSFAFTVNGAAGEAWKEKPDGTLARELIDLNLYEIYTVALPAYKATSVTARSVRAQPLHNSLRRRHLQTRLAAA